MKKKKKEKPKIVYVAVSGTGFVRRRLSSMYEAKVGRKVRGCRRRRIVKTVQLGGYIGFEAYRYNRLRSRSESVHGFLRAHGTVVCRALASESRSLPEVALGQAVTVLRARVGSAERVRAGGRGARGVRWEGAPPPAGGRSVASPARRGTPAVRPRSVSPCCRGCRSDSALHRNLPAGDGFGGSVRGRPPRPARGGRPWATTEAVRLEANRGRNAHAQRATITVSVILQSKVQFSQRSTGAERDVETRALHRRRREKRGKEVLPSTTKPMMPPFGNSSSTFASNASNSTHCTLTLNLLHAE